LNSRSRREAETVPTRAIWVFSRESTGRPVFGRYNRHTESLKNYGSPDGGPKVRILRPPAGSLLRTCLPPSDKVSTAHHQDRGATCDRSKLLSDRLIAGADDVDDPRLGPGIAALAHPPRTARRGAPVDRLGLADRLEQDRIAGRPPGTAAHAVARVVQISAQPGCKR
jgi:hypothetical protein